MPNKGGKIGKNEAKRMLNKLVDYASEKGSDARQELMKQVDEATGGGISGFLSGLAGGAKGGGDAKNVGRFIQSLNPFGGSSGGASSGGSQGGAIKYKNGKLKSTLFGSGKGGASGGGSDGVQRRGELVKRVMKEKNMSLPKASKYVKEQGLYVPESQRSGSENKGGVRIFA